MAVKISITKKLEQKVRELAAIGPVMEHAGTTVRQLISVLDDAHDKQTKRAEQQDGLDPNDVIRTVRSILGSKAYCPPNPGSAFYGFVKAKTKLLNVSLQDIEKAAVHVRDGSEAVKLPCAMEWFIRRLGTVLAEIENAGDGDEGDECTQLVTGRG